MDAILALTSRVSIGRLSAPAPDEKALETLFSAALRAPDHGGLKPWQFHIVEGEAALMKLGQRMADYAEVNDPDLSPEQVQRIRLNPLRAPMVIIATAKLTDSPKVPAVEQLLSAGAAVQNLMLAAHALGFGAMWRTGSMTYSRAFMDSLGLAQNEQIVGFIYIGTAEHAPREPKVPELAAHVKRWGA